MQASPLRRILRAPGKPSPLCIMPQWHALRHRVRLVPLRRPGHGLGAANHRPPPRPGVARRVAAGRSGPKHIPPLQASASPGCQKGYRMRAAPSCGRLPATVCLR